MISLLKVALLPNRIEPADICPPGSGLAGQRVRLVGIDAIFLQRFANLLAINFTTVGQGTQPATVTK